MRICLVPLLVAALASPLNGQALPESVRAAQLSGVVVDSVSGAPLRGATVQLVQAGEGHEVVRSAVSDAKGGFALRDIPPGRYALGFLHPLLDSLGLDVPARELVLAEGDRLQVDLATPAAPRVSVGMCGGSPLSPPAVQFGVIRRATDGVPVAGAIVEGGWREYDFGRRGIGERVARIADTTGVDGRYLLCDVPRGGSVMLRVTASTASSAQIDVDVPASGIGRRDVYVGRAWTGTDGSASDSTAREIDVGEGALQGVVLDREYSRPIAAARVGIVGGRVVRSNAAGEWVLAEIPTGTRLLEVRAVGFTAARISVDVFSGAPPVEVRLSSAGAMLDTIRVRASRQRLEDTGFEERARRGLGRFVTTADMLRRPIINTSQVLETIPGLYVERTMDSLTALQMRGTFSPRCYPSVYIDGHEIRGLSAEELDSYVSPDEVAGIEVYANAFIPAEFTSGRTGCGSIVVWRKMGEHPARSWSWRRRVAHGAAAALVGVGVGALVMRK